MTVHGELKVVLVEAVDDVPVKLTYPTYNGHKYVYKTLLTLEDGQKIEWVETKKLLRDAKVAIASLPEIPKYPTSIKFQDGVAVIKSIEYGFLGS